MNRFKFLSLSSLKLNNNLQLIHSKIHVDNSLTPSFTMALRLWPNDCFKHLDSSQSSSASFKSSKIKVITNTTLLILVIKAIVQKLMWMISQHKNQKKGVVLEAKELISNLMTNKKKHQDLNP